MQFISYHKINGVYENLMDLYKKIDKWCVCEKVHGANFGFYWFKESNIIKYGKRTSFIDDNDIFFGYKEILPNTLPKIQLIIENINKKYELAQRLEKIIIFGELFGGIYPNMKTKSKAIQKEVYYSPNLGFYAFDIYVKKENEDGYFLEYDESCNIFEEVNILYAKPLAIYDNFEDVLKHPIYYESTISEKLGLPKLENNKAEGIIIRNMKKIDKSIFDEHQEYDLLYRYRKIPEKVIIKIKIPEFMENKSENYSLKSWKDKAKAQMTSNRLQSAISKIGELDENNQSQIFKLYIEDILEEIDGKNVVGLREWLYKVHNIKQSI